MNKKGAIKTVVGISILLVFLAVILLAFFCPKCLAPSIAYGSEKIADGVLGGLRKEKFEKTALEIDPAVKAAYDDITKTVREPGKGPCVLNHRAFPDDFKDFRIRLERTKDGNDILAGIIRQRGSGEQRFESRTIAGKALCVVGEGRGIAENFYDNYLDGSVCNSNCPQDFTTIGSNLEFRDKDHIYIGGNKRDSKDRNLVFKSRDGKVCFFLTESDRGSSCGPKSIGVDDDCFDKIAAIVPACGTLRSNLPKIPIVNSGIGAYYQIDDDMIDIRWNEPSDSSYALSLKLENGKDLIPFAIYFEHKLINFLEYGLAGTETLKGQFTKYDKNGQPVEIYSEFTIDLTQRTAPIILTNPGFETELQGKEIDWGGAGDVIRDSIKKHSGEHSLKVNLPIYSKCYALDSGTYKLSAFTLLEEQRSQASLYTLKYNDRECKNFDFTTINDPPVAANIGQNNGVNVWKETSGTFSLSKDQSVVIELRANFGYGWYDDIKLEKIK